MPSASNLRSKFAVVAALAAFVVASAPATSEARSIIKDPNPPQYKVEIEPKLNLSYFGVWDYGGNAIGPGVRFSIPVMSPGFIKKINDSVAITFGTDFLRYEGYDYRYCNRNGCFQYGSPYFWSVHFPVAMQWNFFLTDKWSVFGEVGLTVRRAFYRDEYYYNCDVRGVNCNRDRTDFWGTFFAGGRYHFNENLALTMRLGHPVDFSIGLSIFL
ncbi:MAG: hypothetical protein HYV09_12155 [Deltaproteobacteria bacterium]|nr:hypothetical protein [Deltaproteobacteria bacterium]